MPPILPIHEVLRTIKSLELNKDVSIVSIQTAWAKLSKEKQNLYLKKYKLELQDYEQPAKQVSLLSEEEQKEQDRKIAKLFRGRPSKPPAYYKGLPNHKVSKQVLFYDLYECRCGTSYTRPNLEGQLFDHIVDSPYTSHYEPSLLRNDDVPCEVEYKRKPLMVCPHCVSSPTLPSDFVRMNSFKPRELATPAKPWEPPAAAIPFKLDPQPSLNYERWAYPTSLFPLLPQGRPAIISGVRYARTKRGLVKQFKFAPHPIKLSPIYPYSDLSEKTPVQPFNTDLTRD